MPSPTDFNLSPYFDDFSESKKFHRILFRPAFAVQARELTQSQTILQNQIEKVSDHLFEKGAMVIPGEIAYDLNYKSVKLTSFTGTSTLANLVNVEFTGATSGVIARTINSSVATSDDPNTLYVKYESSGSSNIATTFTDGETCNGTAVIDGISTAVSFVVDSTAIGCASAIKKGVYYINGFQVEVADQTIILDKYTNKPSYRVGLTVTESFITSNEDASLNDNAQGTSNQNAPGANRFKIDLTLTKKTISSTEDAGFVELLRLKEGLIQNQVRTTDYGVLEDTFARRTYDESGDYAVRDFDLDLREHLKSGENRGIYASPVGDASKIAAGLGAGKAYVRGYEISTLGTNFVDIDKARDFDTQNNFKTRFDVENYVNVNNIYGTPDVGFVSGDTETFKKVSLHKLASASRGSQIMQGNSDINKIGIAKSRGFEYKSGTESNDILSSSSLTSAVYKHYLFDIEMYTHLQLLGKRTYTTGETVTGGTSGATGVVVEKVEGGGIATGITTASPGVVTINDHGFKNGMQVHMTDVADSTAADMQIDGVAVSFPRTFTVRNADVNTFELYDVDGTTAINVSNAPTASQHRFDHTCLSLSNVQGEFVADETITGGTSAVVTSTQADRRGFKAVREYDFRDSKQISMAGTPVFTADTALDSTNGEATILSGNINVTNNTTTVIGNGTRFTEELEVGDRIEVNNVNGVSKNAIVQEIIDNSNMVVETTFDATNNISSGVITKTRAKLNGSEKNISIFELPYQTIKTLKTTGNSEITDTSFKVRRQFTQTLSSNGDATITAGTNETFAAEDQGDYTVSIMAAGSGSVGVAGDVLSVSGNNHEGDAVFTLAGSPTGKTLTIDYGINFAGHKIKILATVDRSVAASKTKTLNSNITLQASDQTEIESGVVKLGYADIKEIKSIKMATNFSTNALAGDTDITERFDLDTGQRDNFYDIGRIKLKTGQLTPTGRLLITFDYFSHGSGDYFDVDSYSGTISYENIPSYTSDTTGKSYELRDCLDFRPRVDDASTLTDRSYDGTGASPVDPVKFNSDVTSDFEFYLPRIDKIYLDQEGNFKVSKGASALTPQVPKTIDGAMHLYTLELPSYTLSTDDITIKKVDNRRYTMRDIGRLEGRIENLEYYTQLSLLETQAQNLQIQDAEGFDRFKNGFVVDNFTGHQIGDSGNIDYKCSMDMASGELRPLFHEDAIQLIESDDDGTAILNTDRTNAGYVKTGDLLTLPYTETDLITQPFASKTLNVNPFDVITWSGSIALTPPGDEWKETERAPELVINNTGAFDTLASDIGNASLNGIEIGTVWNEWQDQWTGTPRDVASRDVGGNQRSGRRVFRRTEIETNQSVRQSRTGIRQRIVPQTVRNSIGDRIVSVAFVPFVRSRTITFSATRMKPNTRLYPFFDNIDVSSYCTPDGGALGGNVVTDASGAVSGTFAIPDPTNNANPRWRTGTRVFRLTSSAQNDRSSDVETAAEEDYTARGILETVQNTILSTREPRIVRESTNDTRNINRTSTRSSTRTIGWVDPLAQTFLVDDEGGVFITSLDIFFSSKDDNIPVTIQIREVVNGYPGKTILPFSEVSLNPSSVNVSTDGTVATKFSFDGPVYLQENTEYCFVLLANTTDYNVYAARLGETQLNSDRTISQQPYAGVLFKSQNGSTWTSEPNEDLKFTMRRAEYSTTPGTITLANDTLGTRALKTNPFRTTDTSNVVRVYHPNHGMHGTTNNVTISGVQNDTYNGIPHTELNGTHTAISNITFDSYDITVTSTATATGDVGSTGVIATQNRPFDTLNLNIQALEVAGSTITTAVQTTTGKSMHGSESEFSMTTKANEAAVVLNDNIYFTTPQMVASEINETNEMAGSKSLLVHITMSTNNSRLSPAIDLQRTSAIVVKNRLDSPTSGNTPDYVAETANNSGSSSAKYISKPVVLKNASTALDIRLSANVRSSSEVEVYFRTSSSAEVRNISDLNWIPFNGTGREDITQTPSENDETFNEYKYSKKGMTEFTAFQIKIVMKGTISSYPPRIKDMRGIALAL